MDGAATAGRNRPDTAALRSAQASCRAFLDDRGRLEALYLTVLRGMLPVAHPLLADPALARDLLETVLRAVLAGDTPERGEAWCEACGERCAAAGVPDDAYPAVARSVSRVARELSGDDWSTAASSDWVAIHVWVVDRLLAGAARNRPPAPAWDPFAAAESPFPRASAVPAARPDRDPSASGPSADDRSGPEVPAGDRPARRGPRGRRAAATAPDWSNVWGDVDGLSSWAFDRTEKTRRPPPDRSS